VRSQRTQLGLSLGLSLVLLLNPTPLSSEVIKKSNSKAGRRFSVGETLPKELAERIPWSTPLKKVGMLLFTRGDQEFSLNLKERLRQKLPPIIYKQVPIVEFQEPVAPESLQLQLSHQHVIIHDTNRVWYETFGLIVYPTVLFIGRDTTVLAYFAGYTPSTLLKIRVFLSDYFPSLQVPAQPQFTAQERRGIRRHNFARRLFSQKKYSLVLKFLPPDSEMTRSDSLLQAYCFLELGQDSLAQTSFQVLDTTGVEKYFIWFGLGILHYRKQEWDAAKRYFYAIPVMPDMWRLHYWRGRTMEKLNSPDSALREYRQGIRQLLQHQPPLELP